MATTPIDAGQRQGMVLDPLLSGVLAAENALTHAWQDLNELRRAAFYGGRYDSAQYGRAVVAYHSAETALRAARAAWHSQHAAPMRLACPSQAPAQCPE
jgi:hypothetical protein